MIQIGHLLHFRQNNFSDRKGKVSYVQITNSIGKTLKHPPQPAFLKEKNYSSMRSFKHLACQWISFIFFMVPIFR